MKIFRYISMIAIILIATFVNLNKESPIWDLVFNSQYYLIVSIFIYIGFELCKDIVTQSTLFTLGFYYLFELIMDIVHVFNNELYHKLYSTYTINYTLCAGLILALITIPTIKYIKKIVKRFKTRTNV